MTLGSWEVDVAMLIAIAALTWLVQTIRRDLHEQRARLDRVADSLPTASQISDIRADLARLQERTEQTLRETHNSREAVRRVEDYLLQKEKP